MVILTEDSKIFWLSVKILTIFRVGKCWIHQTLSACCYLSCLEVLEINGPGKYWQYGEGATENQKWLILFSLSTTKPNHDWPSVLKKSSKTIYREEAKLQERENFNIRNWKWGGSRCMHLLQWKAQAGML